MGKDALPCIICNKALTNVAPEFTVNQPNDGVCFTSHGNYGSTVFDPMDGQYITINICDACLVERRDDGAILLGRDSRPVVISGWGVCGSEKVERSSVTWREGLGDSENDEQCFIDWSDLPIYINDKNIRWHIDPYEILKRGPNPYGP